MGMKETVTRLYLCGMHRWDSPYRRQGGDNTSLQPRVVNKQQRERLFGVGNAPIVIEITADNVRGVEEHCLECGAELGTSDDGAFGKRGEG